MALAPPDPRFAVPRGLFSEFEERRARRCVSCCDSSLRPAQRPARVSRTTPLARQLDRNAPAPAWGPLAESCADRRLELANVTSADLEGFLALRSVRRPMRDRPTRTRSLDGRYAYRLLSLIDKLAASTRPSGPARRRTPRRRS